MAYRVRIGKSTSRRDRRDCVRTPYVVLVEVYVDGAMAAPRMMDIQTFGQFRYSGDSDSRTFRYFEWHGASQNVRPRLCVGLEWPFSRLRQFDNHITYDLQGGIKLEQPPDCNKN